MKKKFGDYLRELRKEKNMSQQELADLLGTTKQVISKYETNQRTPKITVVDEYAKKLNIPLNYLLKGELSPKYPRIGGIDENGNFVEEFSEEETLEIIRDLAKLPDESVGDLKLMLDVLNQKYNKKG